MFLHPPTDKVMDTDTTSAYLGNDRRPVYMFDACDIDWIAPLTQEQLKGDLDFTKKP
jgi:hypothetical protein